MAKGLLALTKSCASGADTNIDLPPVMTVAEVTELLRLSKNTVYEGLRSGAIPGMLKVGRAVRVSGPVLTRWLQEGGSPSRKRSGRHAG